MSGPKIGSLFSGVAGLDRAVEQFFDADVAWFVEFDSAPSKVLAHHYPDVPNYGDVTAVDWSTVEPVDIITGGSPCQDLSGAGKRRGMTEGTRSNLWVQMREAIAILKPRYVVWENVRGAYSAAADSEVESEPGLLGVFGEHRPALRALGRVLGDLSELGYDTKWVGLRAADAGVPHGRFRVFVVAHSHGHESERDRRNRQLVGSARTGEGDIKQRKRVRHAARSGSKATPNAGRIGGDESDQPAERSPESKDRASVADERGPHNTGTIWGEYEPAIRRWESTLGRLAPNPTNPDGKDGRHRLSPQFTEWLMGLPEGWVTAPEIGLSWQEQLKVCGNGVVPQQAALALTHLLDRRTT